MATSSTAGHGRLDVITGPMFSAKTDSLIDRLEDLLRADASVLAVKPRVDRRFEPHQLVSHSGRTYPARSVDDLRDERSDLSRFDVIGMDEVQFFPTSIARAALRLRAEGMTVIAAGLDLDYLGRPFESTAALVASADSVERRAATCGACGETATFTQRLVDGLPAPADDMRIRIGSAELYQPRCARCFVAEKLPRRVAVSRRHRLRPTGS